MKLGMDYNIQDSLRCISDNWPIYACHRSRALRRKRMNDKIVISHPLLAKQIVGQMFHSAKGTIHYSTSN